MKTLTLLFLLSIPFLAVGQGLIDCKLTLGGVSSGEITREDVEKILRNPQLIFESEKCRGIKIYEFNLVSVPQRGKFISRRFTSSELSSALPYLLKPGQMIVFNQIWVDCYGGGRCMFEGALVYNVSDYGFPEIILPEPETDTAVPARLIEFIYPVNKTVFQNFSETHIFWKDNGRSPKEVFIEYSCDKGKTWELYDFVANDNKYRWDIYNVKRSKKCQTRKVYDIEDSLKTKPIREYSCDKGKTWELIDDAAWEKILIEVSSKKCKIRAINAEDTTNVITSKGYFSITKNEGRKLEFTIPSLIYDPHYEYISSTRIKDYTSIFCSCEKLELHIKSENIKEAEILFSSNNGNDWTILDTVRNLKSEDTIFVKLPDLRTSAGRLWIRSIPPMVSETYERNFAVDTMVHGFIYPKKDEKIVSGEDYNIWLYSYPGSKVNMYYSTDNGNTWTFVLSTDAGGRNGYSNLKWQVPDVTSDECFIKLVVANNPDVFFLSDKFSIVKEGEEE